MYRKSLDSSLAAVSLKNKVLLKQHEVKKTLTLAHAGTTVFIHHVSRKKKKIKEIIIIIIIIIITIIIIIKTKNVISRVTLRCEATCT